MVGARRPLDLDRGQLHGPGRGGERAGADRACPSGRHRVAGAGAQGGLAGGALIHRAHPSGAPAGRRPGPCQGGPWLSSDGEAVAVRDERDRAPVGGADGGDRGFRIASQLEVGQQNPTRPGCRRERTHRGPVEVEIADGDRSGPEGDLDQERVAGPHERRQVGGPAAIAGEDEAAAPRSPAGETRMA